MSRNSCVALLCLLTLAVAGCGSGKPPDAPPSGFSLRVDSSVWTVQAGTQAGLPVILGRFGGHSAPIQLQLRGLPEGLDHTPVVVQSLEQWSAVLTVTVDAGATPGTYPVEVVASDGALMDSRPLSLEVQPASSTGAIVLTFEPQVPVLLKGQTHEVPVLVSRPTRFQGEFRIESSSGPVKAASRLVAADATRFLLTLTVDERLPVGYHELFLSMRVGEQLEHQGFTVQVTAPPEAAPQLTSATPPDMIRGLPAEIVLRGSGLSGTTSVVLRRASGAGEPIPAAVVTTLSGQVVLSLRVPYGDDLTFDHELVLTTAAGTATLPFEVSTLHVDPAAGSDTAGRGTRVSPFASILKARTTCSSCVWPQCGSCPIYLAPGVHRPGRLDLHAPVALLGLGGLYGDHPTVLEGQEGDRFTVTGVKLQNLKVTGFDKGVEARSTQRGDELLVPELEDVWLTGNGYGVSSQTWVTLSSSRVGTRIEGNRIAGIAAFSTLLGTEAHPIEVTGNGDGTDIAGGIIGAVERAEHVRVERNRGAGAKVLRFTARDSTFRDNEGPGVWVTGSPSAYVVDLGTAASPGRNTLQGNAVNLRVDTGADPLVSAVGNCWDVPVGEDFPEAVADGACGRLGGRFERDGVAYIDSQGRALVPFTWTGTPRFNYWLGLSPNGASTGIQF